MSDSQPTGAMVQTRYAAVVQQLLSRIEVGEWAVGSTLPTERDLSAALDVSRSTVRLALQQIESWGMVTRKQKRGTVLRALKPRTTYQQQIGALEQLEDFSHQTSLIVSFLDIAPGALVASRHEVAVPPETRWVRYTGWRTWRGGEERISWTEVFFDGVYEGIKDRIGFDPRPTYKIIEETFGVSVVGIEQSVRARGFPADAAAALGCAEGEPGLEVKRLMIRDDGRPLLATHSIHRADAVSMRMRFGLRGLDSTTVWASDKPKSAS